MAAFTPLRASFALASLVFLTQSAGAQSLLYEHEGDGIYDRLGAAASRVGDMDGDGELDYVAGAPENFQILLAEPGYVRAYSGATGLPLMTWNGGSFAEEFGASVAAAGDADGDGTPDFIVGVPQNSDNASLAGAARVYSGATGQMIREFLGDATGDELGRAVGGDVDVNGDGRADLIAGSRNADANGNNSGLARVYSGLTGTVIHEFPGSGPNKRMGASVSGLGDVNGDGRDDVLIGSYFDGVKVFSGIDGSLIHNFPNPSDDDIYGWSVGRLDDVSGDGVDELLIGATQDSVFSPGAGYVEVRSGASGSLLFTVNGNQTGDRFGISVSSVGDFDADGTPDFAVGADESQSGGFGYVRICSGIDGAALHTEVGTEAISRFGTAVAGLGDVNGDGRPDVAMGEPGASPNSLASGELRVISGDSGTGNCADPENYCSTAPNSVGAGAVIATSGSTSLSLNNLILLASNCPPDEFGIFFYGPNQIQIPFGNGWRCVGAGGFSVFRLPIINTGPAGLAAFPLDFDNMPDGGDLAPFEVTNFQFWYRDPGAGGATFNLSDAVEVQICP